MITLRLQLSTCILYSGSGRSNSQLCSRSVICQLSKEAIQLDLAETV